MAEAPESRIQPSASPAVMKILANSMACSSSQTLRAANVLIDAMMAGSMLAVHGRVPGDFCGASPRPFRHAAAQ